MKSTLGLLVGAALAGWISAPEGRGGAYDQPGPHAVETRAFPDLKRQDRPVPIKVLRPAGEGRFPLVIFSHGGAGTWRATAMSCFAWNTSAATASVSPTTWAGQGGA